MGSSEIDFEEKLILLVQEKPFLYQKSRTDYKDAPKKQNAWASISVAINRSVEYCKTTWDNIRKQYTAYLKKLDNPTGSGRCTEPFFRHSRAMEFYKDSYRPHKNKTVTNYEMPLTPDSPEQPENEEALDISDRLFEDSQVIHDYEDVQELIEINNTRSAVQNTQSGHYSINVQPSRPKSKRKANDDFEKKFLDLYEKSASQKEDEFYFFGQVVAGKLRKLNTEGSDTMELQIKVLQLLNSKPVDPLDTH